jgi:hypothetical protein
MINKITAAVVAAMLVASTAVAPAQVRHGRHHARPHTSAQMPGTASARTIEIRPGLWVGSYQCVTDVDRGGRDCSAGI